MAAGSVPPTWNCCAKSCFYDHRDQRDALVLFGVLLALSTVIAAGGVVDDSTATVIGAMIIAPLMTPMMASASGKFPRPPNQLGTSGAATGPRGYPVTDRPFPWPPSAWVSRSSRARATLDRIVPIGHRQISAASA